MQLAEEAERLYPVLCELYESLQTNDISQPDFIGAYILAYIAVRYPKRWICGKLGPVIGGSEIDGIQSLVISRRASLLSLLNADYLTSKFKNSASTIRICDIYNTCRLKSLKNNKHDVVNFSLMHWYCGRRPYVLMHSIPSPITVLRMQAQGQRVITAFVELAQLSSVHRAQLVYMSNDIEHERDALDFLTHDMQHMEHFTNPISYEEQVGFFNCVLKWGESLDISPRKFVATLFPSDNMLWHELENCFVPHLMKYVFAKMLFAMKRQSCIPPDQNLTSDQLIEFCSKWCCVLLECGMKEDSDAFAAGISIYLSGTQQNSVDRGNGRIYIKMPPEEEGEVLRGYFQRCCGCILQTH